MVHLPPAEDIPLAPSPGTPGEGGGEALPPDTDLVHLAQSCTATPAVAPRPSLLQRFSASRASTLTSLLLALALHAALLSLAYIYHISTKPTELPDLPLPQGFATESPDAPSHPTVTFTDTPTPFSREPQASAPFPNPTPKNLLTPPPTDFTPPDPPSPDLTLGPTEDTTDLVPPSTNTIPARPDRRSSASVAAGQPPTDAPANPAAAANPTTSPVTLASASNTSSTPQGTPDVPPTPSSRNKVPPYPPDALRRRLAGTVLLELRIADTGRVTDAVIQQSSGHDLLDTSARDTALTWTFTPARLEGRPVPITVLRPVNFIPPR